MKVSAKLENTNGVNKITLQTNETSHSINIPPKPGGFGLSTNGGELLFLAIAACYCNDIYREAQKRKIEVTGVSVSVSGEFGAEGEPAKNVKYDVKISSSEEVQVVENLVKFTDSVAEIHNSLRRGTKVTLNHIEIINT